MGLKEKLVRMIETRKIIAIMVIMAFVILAFNGTLEVNFIQTVIISVISFYFGQSTALDDPHPHNEGRD